MSSITRRDFTKATLTVAATVATAASADRVAGANERVRLGVIGIGNRGDQVLSAFLEQKDCQVVAVCDIYQPYRQYAASRIEGTPEQFTDYRKLLDRKDLDAVMIATPDHWHALQMIHACQAGKDVYVEKPACVYVNEGRAMVKAANDHQRIVQVGIQRMSSDFCREAAELIRGGAIGKVTVVRSFHVQNEWPKGIGNPPDEEAPADFDWNAWTGPAKMRKYNKNRTFYRFRWFYDFSGGQLTNFGVHHLAQIHRSLGVDAPLAVMAMGGKFSNYDNREVPDTMEVVWHYPGDTLVVFSQYNANGAAPSGRPCEIEFRGTKGTLYFGTWGYEIVPETIKLGEFMARSPIDRERERHWNTGASPQIEGKKVAGRVLDTEHARVFLDCVKSRKQPTCDMEYGHRCTTGALIANIAHRTRSFLEWDAKAEMFTNNPAANAMLRSDYRKPYELPE
ncbi:Gfo/Idh/MocA family protein [Schlesneria paludicola]|uniref:Gfo/Idh/MocA family protein n=1 Tax=Schlesneria paludicola TaxID=360056 RepID=UPI00029A20B4|nr:Gfo/Idh/MocA family oxidoreductase [Schlesneria paludicola]